MIPAIGSGLPVLDARRVDSLGTATSGAPGAAAPAVGADFGSVLAKVSTQAADAVKGAEAASLSGIKGETSTQSVVDAVMGAERALQTAVVIRDKVVAAYQEITRMAI